MILNKKRLILIILTITLLTLFVSYIIINSNYNLKEIDIVLIIVASILTFFIIFLSENRIIQPIGKVITHIKKITHEKNDLTNKIDLSAKSDLGDFVFLFNNYLTNMRDFVAKLKMLGGITKKISNNLFTNTDQTASYIMLVLECIQLIKQKSADLDQDIEKSYIVNKKTNERIDSLSLKIESQSSIVTESTSSIQNMLFSIQNIAEISKNKSVMTNKLLDITKSSKELVNSTNQQLEDIVKNSSEIFSLIDIINNISSKTNLLAMNAAIEAAHAGQYGKGFAIVADEIRKLAESTSTNSKLISDTLNTSIKKTTNVLEKSRENAVAFETINKEVDQVSIAFNDISRHISELASGSNQILEGIKTLIKITSEIKSDYDDIKANTHDIITSIASIKDISQTSLNGIEDMSSVTDEINNILEDMKQICFENKNNVEELNLELNIFKTENSSENELEITLHTT